MKNRCLIPLLLASSILASCVTEEKTVNSGSSSSSGPLAMSSFASRKDNASFPVTEIEFAEFFVATARVVATLKDEQKGNATFTENHSVVPSPLDDSDGYYGLSATSPSIDAASESYPAIYDVLELDDDPTLTLDVSRQARPDSKTLKDVGCDEYSTEITPNHPLVLSEVGPSYLGGPAGGLSISNPITYANNIIITPNPASTQININFNNITNLDGGTLKIINSLGQQVATTQITTSGTQSIKQLATWGESGMYFVQIINPQGQIVDVKKIILQ